MKRGLITLALGILLLTALSIAGDNDVPETAISPEVPSEETPNDIQKTTTDILNELKEKTKNESLKEQLALEKDIEIFSTPLPTFLEKPTRILFNVDGDVSLEKFIVLVGVLLIIFFVVLEALTFSTLSEGLNYIIAICITLITGISGQVIFIANNFYLLTDKVMFLGGMTKIKLFIALIVVLTIIIVLKILTKKFMKSKKKERAREGGSEIKNASKNAKAINDAVSS
jgi:hypothetical protein